MSPWEEAILGVPETKVGFTKKEAETQGHKDFIDGLITEIDKYNTDINNRRWFRINDKGEKIFFVEKVVFQLERYAQIGDVAIQHNPDVVALVWAGFRFLLQVVMPKVSLLHRRAALTVNQDRVSIHEGYADSNGRYRTHCLQHMRMSYL